MGLFYRLAHFCFMGGTLVPLGGHNVLEPARLHCAVLAGPNIASAPAAYESIFAAQGFGRVGSSADIAREAAKLLSDSSLAKEAGDAAARGAATLSGAVGRTADALKVLLDARA
jgi:3-deoxy-D-manno-octulosonic-acid transferase